MRTKRIEPICSRLKTKVNSGRGPLQFILLTVKKLSEKRKGSVTYRQVRTPYTVSFIFLISVYLFFTIYGMDLCIIR
jgi:hypothetical protein